MATETKVFDKAAPQSREILNTRGRTYEILRYYAAMNLAQTIDATEGFKAEGKVMLTRQDAREISDNTESNAIFKERLKEGEWTYVRDSDAESRSLAAYLSHDMFDGRLYVDDDDGPDYVSRVVVLKKTGNETAAAPQEQTKVSNELLLRKADAVEDALSRLSGREDDMETVRDFVKMVRNPGPK